MSGTAHSAARVSYSLLPPESKTLVSFSQRLASAPRRREFKSVPMILNAPEQWDHEALTAVMSYEGSPKQVWDNTEIGSPWLNLMRNSLNTQIWSFRHPEFLVVSATHGTAHLALYDQGAWDKYRLAKLAGDKFKTNTLLQQKAAAPAGPGDYQNPTGAFSPEDNSIPTLMQRGVVFLSCHNAIWEQAASLLKAGSNPDGLTHEQLAADLTNHLIPGVVLTPGAVGTLPELQRAGFSYAK